MANTPVPQNYQQIISNMLDYLTANTGIQTFKKGNPILTILEAAAQSDLRSSQTILDFIRSVSLDDATGQALELIAISEGTQKLGALPSSGFVDFTDTSFSKIESRIYGANNQASAGSTTIEVLDTSSFPTSGSVYIGRGTTNEEGPVSYTGKTATTLTGLTALTLSHATGESVILAQGGERVINGGTEVFVLSGIGSKISFETLSDVRMRDGENTVSDVSVVAKEAGESGNVVANSITGTSSSVGGLTVNNSKGTYGGREVEIEYDLRERVRKLRQSRSKGTSLSLESGVIGASSESGQVIVSSAIVEETGNATLYIDNGKGYEETFEGVPFEILTSSALGGERYFELLEKPVAQAVLVSEESSPWNLPDGITLSVVIENALSTHTFYSLDFKNPNSASAYEVVSSVNKNKDLLFSAKVVQNGTKVALFAKSPFLHRIELFSLSGDSSAVFNFPKLSTDTLNLYKNDVLLKRDDKKALILSQIQSNWISAATGTVGTPVITLEIDNTPAISYLWSQADQIRYGNISYLSSTLNIDLWVEFLQQRIPGVVVSSIDNRIQIESCFGTALSITGGQVVNIGMFLGTEVSVGVKSQYSLNLNTAQIKLVDVLEPGDYLAVGTENPSSFIEISNPDGITFSSANVYFVVDGAVEVLTDSVPNTLTYDVTYSSPKATYTKNPSVIDFATLFRSQTDWAIINAGTVTTGALTVPVVSRIGNFASSSFSLEQNSSVSTGSQFTNYDFFRTTKTPQLLSLSGTYSASQLAAAINASILGVTASVYKNNVRIHVNSEDSVGEVAIVSLNAGAIASGIFTKQIANNERQMSAILESQSAWPATAFRARKIQSATNSGTTGTYAFPNGTYLDYSPMPVKGTDVVKYLPVGNTANTFTYGTSNINNYDIPTAIATAEPAVLSWKNLYSEHNKYDGDLASVVPSLAMAPDDSISFIVDSDVSKNYQVNMSQELTLNNTLWASPLNIGNLSWAPTDYFNDFAVYAQARGTSHLGHSNQANLKTVWKHNRYGSEGENTVISFSSPEAENSALSAREGFSTVDGLNHVNIFMPSGALKSQTIPQGTYFHSVSQNWILTNSVLVANISVFPDVPVGTVRLNFLNSTTITHNAKVGDLIMVTTVPGGSTLTHGPKALTGVGDTFVEYSDSTTTKGSGSLLFKWVANQCGTVATASATNWDSDTIELSIASSQSKFPKNSVVFFSGAVLASGGAQAAQGAYSVIDNDGVTVTIKPVGGSLASNTGPLSGPHKISTGITTRRTVTETVYKFAFGKVTATTGPGSTVTCAFTSGTGSGLSQVGLQVGDSVYLSGNNADFPDGYKTITAVTSNSFSYRENGTVNASSSTAEITVRGSITPVSFVQAAGDVYSSSQSEFEVKNGLSTSAVLDSGTLTDRLEFYDYGSFVSGIPYRLTSTDSIKVFPINYSTIGQVEAFVNNTANGLSVTADYYGANSSTLIPNITLHEFSTSTLNSINSGSQVSVSGYSLYDGLNSVLTTTVGGTTDLALKWPLLANTTGWTFSGEKIKIAPVLPYQVSKWMALPELFALSSVATVTTTKNGDGVQVSRTDLGSATSLQYAGGSANSRSISVVNSPSYYPSRNFAKIGAFEIPKDLTGFTGGQWVKVTNSFANPYSFSWSGTPSVTISNGIMTLSAGSLISSLISGQTCTIKRVGDLFQLTVSTTNFSTTVVPGYKILVANNTSGTVVYLEGVIAGIDHSSATFWVDGIGTEGVFNPAQVSTYVSEMPYKGVQIDTQGQLGSNKTITIEGISGGSAASGLQFRVSGAVDGTWAWNPLFVNMVFLLPSNYSTYGQVVGYSYGTENDFLILSPQVLPVDKTTQAWSFISKNPILSVMNKLQMPEQIVKGLDGYKYNTGLLAEANKIVYGDNSKSFAYPGLHASGTLVNISGPLIKRLSISLTVRLNTSNTKSLIASIKNAVAKVINSSYVGQNVAISDIIQSANSVLGVESVVVTDPIFNTANDLIPVQLNEKALILDPELDISVFINE